MTTTVNSAASIRLSHIVSVWLARARKHQLSVDTRLELDLHTCVMRHAFCVTSSGHDMDNSVQTGFVARHADTFISECTSARAPLLTAQQPLTLAVLLWMPEIPGAAAIMTAPVRSAAPPSIRRCERPPAMVAGTGLSKEPKDMVSGVRLALVSRSARATELMDSARDPQSPPQVSLWCAVASPGQSS